MAMFGWCLDKHHDGCLIDIPNHRCGCACHTNPELDPSNLPIVKEKR